MHAYKVISHLGSGSFGRVYKIERIRDGKELVWKELCYGKMTDKEKQMLVSEVNIIKDLRHAYIVRYYDRIIDRQNKKIYIVMEYCPCGDLGQFIEKNRKANTRISEDIIWRILTQLCLALKACHHRKEGKIIHRDLKPANVMIDDNFNIKLGDFGLARILSEHSKFAHTNVGTPFYMSPEQINEQAYDEKSDIWGLGCIIYELCCLRAPFEAKTQTMLAKKIESGIYEPIPGEYSNELAKIIARMLTVNQHKRPNIDEIIACPQVSIRVREIHVKQHMQYLKRKEEELLKKERMVAEKEQMLEAWERRLQLQEQKLKHLGYNKENSLLKNFKLDNVKAFRLAEV